MLCLAGCTALLLVVVDGLLLTTLLLLLVAAASVFERVDVVALCLVFAGVALSELLTGAVPFIRALFMFVLGTALVERPSDTLPAEFLVEVADLPAASVLPADLVCSSAYLLVAFVLLVKERSGCCLS